MPYDFGSHVKLNNRLNPDLKQENRLYNLSNKIIGITGGICSGKTSYCKYLEAHGWPVIYADKLVKEIYKKQIVKDQIKKLEIGTSLVLYSEILDKINFKELKEYAFNVPDILKKLEELIAPFFEGEFFKEYVRLEAYKFHAIYLEHPLIYQKKIEDKFDGVYCLDIDSEEQLKRVIERDNCSEEIAKKIIEVQNGKS